MGTHFKRSEKIRLKKKIVYKMVIYRKDEFDAAMVKGRKYYDVRIIENNFSIPGNVMIWDDNIAIHTYEEPISVIQIKSRPLAKVFMNYFNIMWGIGKDLV
jgi:hypothetical protein